MLLCSEFYTGLHTDTGWIQKMAYKWCILLSCCCNTGSELTVFPHTFRVLHGDLGKYAFAQREHWGCTPTVLSCSPMAQRCSCMSCVPLGTWASQLCSWAAPAIALSLVQEPNSSVSFKMLYFVLTACFRLIFKQFNSTLCWFAVKWMNFLPPL